MRQGLERCRVVDGRVVVLYEHEKCLLSGFSDEFVEAVDRLEVEPLEGGGPVSPIRVGRARGGGEVLVAEDYVGFAAVSGYVVTVLPKAYSGLHVVDAVMGFVHMLDYAYDLGLRVTVGELREAAWRGLHEVFLHLYSHELLSQLRLGIYRRYIRLRGEERFLRGKLLLTQQLRKPQSRLHTFSVEYFLLSTNNPLNRVLRYAAMLGLKWTQLAGTRTRLAEAAMLLEEADTPSLVAADLSKVHFDRLNDRFRKAYQLARIIIQGLGGLAGEEAYGFFTDMNDLFEKYLRNVLKRTLPGRCVVAKERAGHLLRTPDNKGLVEQLPDIKVECGEAVIYIDAKYKSLEKTLSHVKIDEDDVRQAYVYARLLANNYKVARPLVVLTYPYVEGGFNSDVLGDRRVHHYVFNLGDEPEPWLVLLSYDMKRTVRGEIDLEFTNMIRRLLTVAKEGRDIGEMIRGLAENSPISWLGWS